MHASTITLALLSIFPAVFATLSQGTVNMTRDYAIEYSSTNYATTEAFCQVFRSKCVLYAGSIDHHHQLDCVFSQPGPTIRAFCGGIQKNAAGSWTAGEAIEPLTANMIGTVKGAKIVGSPVTKMATISSTKKAAGAKKTTAAKKTTTKKVAKKTANKH